MWGLALAARVLGTRVVLFSVFYVMAWGILCRLSLTCTFELVGSLDAVFIPIDLRSSLFLRDF